MRKKSRKVKTPEHGEFNTMGSRDKVILKKRDFAHVKPHHDPRNKEVTMANGTVHVLMNMTMFEMQRTAPHLLKPNQSVLVSPDIIISKGNDHVSFIVPGKNVLVTERLTEPFAQEFKRRFSLF